MKIDFDPPKLPDLESYSEAIRAHVIEIAKAGAIPEAYFKEHAPTSRSAVSLARGPLRQSFRAAQARYADAFQRIIDHQLVKARRDLRAYLYLWMRVRGRRN